MKRNFVLVCTIFIMTLLVLTGCQINKTDVIEEVTFDEIFANPSQYDGEKVVLDGYYFAGFETMVIAEGMKYSGYADGHLIPDGRLVWVEGGIPIEIYDQLYRQDMMGPEERYGKFRITGIFEYGGAYGHLGGFDCQIIPEEVDLLPWSLPGPLSAGS
ncbi:MAG: hypothetical protein PHQ43_04685 [Dehalococcoidales bacterium]|nr:hypothetical protein [Dehalococcoidales bacterium]